MQGLVAERSRLLVMEHSTAKREQGADGVVESDYRHGAVSLPPANGTVALPLATTTFISRLSSF